MPLRDSVPCAFLQRTHHWGGLPQLKPKKKKNRIVSWLYHPPPQSRYRRAHPTTPRALPAPPPVCAFGAIVCARGGARAGGAGTRGAAVRAVHAAPCHHAQTEAGGGDAGDESCGASSSRDRHSCTRGPGDVYWRSARPGPLHPCLQASNSPGAGAGAFAPTRQICFKPAEFSMQKVTGMRWEVGTIDIEQSINTKPFAMSTHCRRVFVECTNCVPQEVGVWPHLLCSMNRVLGAAVSPVD